MLTNFFRVFNFALTDFNRNKGVTIATIFVLVVIIMLATWLFIFQGLTGFLISQVQDKIDVTAYFKEGTFEEDILKVKSEILVMSPNIKEVEYVSQDKALEIFAENHQDSEVISKALEEVGSNPFLPSLNITTSGDPAEYEEIANILQTDQYADLVDNVDFYEKKDTIEKVYAITKNINIGGLILTAILVIISVLVVFNTTKLAVDSSKDEIGTMKLVGASNWFIRGPFIIQGAIYGIIAFVISMALSAASAYALSSKIAFILPGFSLAEFFTSNIWIFILIQLAFGAGLGMLTSYVAVRKYLKN